MNRGLLLLCFLLFVPNPGAGAVVATTFVDHPFVENPQWINIPGDPSLYVGFSPTLFGGSGYGNREVDIDGDGSPEVYFYGVSNGLMVTTFAGVEIVGSALPPPYVDQATMAVPFFRGQLIGEDAPGVNLFTGWPYPQWLDSDAWPTEVTGGSSSGKSGILANVPGFTFLAIRMEKEDGWHYGWIQIDDFLSGSVGVIGGWAWETEASTPIAVGVIPEPRVGLLVIGSLSAILALRRRPKQQSEQDAALRNQR